MQSFRSSHKASAADKISNVDASHVRGSTSSSESARTADAYKLARKHISAAEEYWTTGPALYGFGPLNTPKKA
jgi:hypothetical protein